MARWTRATGMPPWGRWVLLLLVGLLPSCGGQGERDGQVPQSASGAADAQELAAGKDLYVRQGCPVCHGDQGRGDGRIAQTLRPPPRDFRATGAYKQGTSVAQIATTIEKGAPGGSAMPPYPHLNPRQRLLLAAYVRHLATD
ncbi:MAG: cytochrome c [Candidatus Latescibacterota bacterium]